MGIFLFLFLRLRRRNQVCFTCLKHFAYIVVSAALRIPVSVTTYCIQPNFGPLCIIIWLSERKKIVLFLSKKTEVNRRRWSNNYSNLRRTKTQMCSSSYSDGWPRTWNREKATTAHWGTWWPIIGPYRRSCHGKSGVKY